MSAFPESGSEAWLLRFGYETQKLDSVIAPLLLHRSVRSFAEQDIPESVIEHLVGVAQSASTSSHLQAWSIVSVQEPARRASINEYCGDQAQTAHAPWFFVFVADLAQVRAMAKDQGVDVDAVETTELAMVATIDAALAAERMVCAAEMLGYGCCYIGAMRNHPDKVNELLGLPEGCFAPFGLALGVPLPEKLGDIKPRFRPAQVWRKELYNRIDESEFDSRMAQFYAAQGQNAEVKWSQRMTQRCTHSKLSGREKLLSHLRIQKMYVH